ncbi:MAG: FkbM family methyltransferase [Halobacteriovoraceae bacterium]|nr:FkbM family methyltransferase [Halobacteriovoraceae bacterium]
MTRQEQQTPELLKLDVDGFELSVLSGGLKLIKRYRPFVFMEFDTKLMDKVNEDPNSILNIFKENNYSSVKVWDNFSNFIKETQNLDEIIPISRNLDHYANVLFVP